MDKLPKDIVEKITGYLSPSDLLLFCESETRKDVFDNNDFWIRKFKKDFVGLMELNFDRKLLGNSKVLYCDFINEIYETVNTIINDILVSFEDFRKYLTLEYKKDMSTIIYDYILRLLNSIKYDISYDSIKRYVSHTVSSIQTKIIPPLIDDGSHEDDLYDIISKPIQTILEFIYEYLELLHSPVEPAPTYAPTVEGDVLQVVPIEGQDNIYREMMHGFIIQVDDDGNLTALAIGKNGVSRALTENEKKIALSLGLRVINH